MKGYYSLIFTNRLLMEWQYRLNRSSKSKSFYYNYNPRGIRLRLPSSRAVWTRAVCEVVTLVSPREYSRVFTPRWNDFTHLSRESSHCQRPLPSAFLCFLGTLSYETTDLQPFRTHHYCNRQIWRQSCVLEIKFLKIMLYYVQRAFVNIFFNFPDIRLIIDVNFINIFYFLTTCLPA